MTLAVDTFQGFTQLATDLGFEPAEFIEYAMEDEIGGFPENWQSGAIYAAEGQALYAIVRCLRPTFIVEFGTRRGCSTSHLALGCHANELGCVYTVDRSKAVGDLIPESLKSRVVLITSDGVDWSSKIIPPGTGLVFEDGPHTSEFTYEVTHNCLKSPSVVKGAIILCHDILHSRVGEEVTKGFKKATGKYQTVSLSAAGLGYVRKTHTSWWSNPGK